MFPEINAVSGLRVCTGSGYSPIGRGTLTCIAPCGNGGDWAWRRAYLGGSGTREFQCSLVDPGRVFVRFLPDRDVAAERIAVHFPGGIWQRSGDHAVLTTKAAVYSFTMA